ncbi:hypothetical protein P3H80_26035 [Mycolicibacterium septicum]|uniref:hypothetical protein n=1 Tax=Mycolicibacterium septicum TaxID=98668 RepID=UPI0023E13ADC|nr:hypothetical protein [Mycolicibacterium septicum]MDF3340917.1 hypothetical protein [Mycolicibacterium septicum]
MALVAGFDPANSGQQPVDENGDPVPVGVWGDSDVGGGVFGSSGVLPSGTTVFIDPPAGVEGHGADGPGVVGRSPAGNGVVGESLQAPGILARSSTASGLLGVTFSPTDDSHGVFGSSTTGGNGVTGFVGGATGVIGSSIRGFGVRGTSGDNAGVMGISFADGGSAPGVFGTGDNTMGVLGTSSNGPGVYGVSQTTDAIAGLTYGVGVSGVSGLHVVADSTGSGVSGHSHSGTGVRGSSDDQVGVRGVSLSSDGTAGLTTGTGHGVSGVHFSTHPGGGVSGLSVIGNGVEGFTFADTRRNPDVAAVRGQSANGFAGLFVGRVRVTGFLSKSGGGFTVDHPADPANRYLSHSFVESPDMLNVYSGTVTTDRSGRARVKLPSYFEALNRDFRYQLTVIGTFSQAVVAEEIKDNAFTIATDTGRVKVCWQVTGVRKDAWAEANRVTPEQRKPDAERGTYLHPELFGRKAVALHPAPTARVAEVVPVELSEWAERLPADLRLMSGQKLIGYVTRARRVLRAAWAADRKHAEKRLGTVPELPPPGVGHAELQEQWKAVRDAVAAMPSRISESQTRARRSSSSPRRPRRARRR